MSALPVDIADPGLANRLADGMSQVEDRLRAAVHTDYDPLSAAAGHLIAAGGSRLRPFLTLLGAEFGTGVNAEAVKAAVAVELAHVATLYHDDIMDAASYRRGVRSAHELWGRSVAVIAGDFVFAQATGLISELGADAIHLYTKTFTRLVQGQVAETAGPQPDETAIDHHLKVLTGKTSSLFSCSGHIGSLVAGASDTVIAMVDAACEAWGLAYQLSDDVLDITSDASKFGKLPGADLRQGVLTLPTIYATRSTRPSDARLLELLRYDKLDDDGLHAEALALLRAHPAIDQARTEVRRWTETAKSHLHTLPDSPARHAFFTLCDFVASRVAA